MIAVIFHRLGPYHFARLRAASALAPFVAVETSGADETYAWDLITGEAGFKRVTLFEHADAQKQPAHEVIRRMNAALDQLRPTVVVVPGWSDTAALAALQWCINHKIPAVCMSESTVWDEPRKVWKEFIKRQVLGLFASALAGGTPHREYLEQLGMARDRIFLGYDAVDNGYFADKAAEIRNRKSETRNKLGLPEKYFLASNRFIAKKNLTRLIQAYARYRELASQSQVANRKSEIWQLVLLGDGELRPAINQQLATSNLQPFVHLPGFKQYPELPDYYAGAGVFIHASTSEQWGLVVNEAMASGLPVLVSNRCGCARDLVQDGVNGFTFNPYDVEDLAQLMLKISDFRFPISDFGLASQRIIANWGPEQFAGGLKQATDRAMRVGPITTTSIQRVALKTLLTR
jgi:glycosyltransferase involved in cell wall biosynthesis